RLCGELPLLALSRRDGLGVQAVRRDRTGQARGHRRPGLDARRRGGDVERHPVRGVRLAALLGGAGRRPRARRAGIARRRAEHPPDASHLRRLQGALVRDRRRPAAVRGACDAVVGAGLTVSLSELGALTLFVEDLGRTKAFYRDVFGLETVYE